MPKIKVAFFADMLTDDFDGCIRTIQQLVNRIPEEEFDFTFFSGALPVKQQNRKYIKLSSISIPFNKGYKMVPPLPNKKLILQELKKINPDIIHISNPSLLGKFVANYANGNGIPLSTIYHTHFVTYVKYYLRFMKPLIPFMEKRVTAMTKGIYDLCDLVYLPVPSIKDDFKAMNIRTDNCKIWPRGIDAKIFNPNKLDARYFKTLTQNDNSNILFASRLVWEKNLDTLIEIYELAEAEKLPYNFIIAGDGGAGNSLKTKMPNAYFLGSLNHDELSKVYASSDVFLFPSDTETYGNVIIEAMSSGLPAVAANSGGPTGIINDGVNGFLCSSHDARDYLNRIERLLNDKSLYDSVRSNGLEMTNSLSWENLAKQYFQDLKQLNSVHKSKKVLS